MNQRGKDTQPAFGAGQEPLLDDGSQDFSHNEPAVGGRVSAFGDMQQGYTQALGLLGLGAGFVTTIMDMAEPLAPFTMVAFCIGVVLSGLLLVGFSQRRWRSKLRTPLMFILLVTAFSGAMWAWRSMLPPDEQDSGALAATFPGLATLQGSVGLMQTDVADIAETSRRSAASLESVAANSARSADALGGIAEGLAGMRRLGGLIDEPASLSDFLNNAAVYDERGDLFNLRRTYEEIVALNQPYADVYARYAEIVKSQEGNAGARRLMNEIAARQTGNPAAQLVAINMSPIGDREARYASLAQQYPEFGPVYRAQAMYTSELFMEQGLTATAAEERRRIQAWSNYVEAFEAGNVLRWYVDKTESQNFYIMAKQTANQSQQYRAKPPVEYKTDHFAGYFMLDIILTDGATKIWLRPDGQDEFVEQALIDHETLEYGEAPATFFREGPNGRVAGLLRLFFSADDDAKPYRYDVRYADARGEIHGPFPVELTPDVYFAEEARERTRRRSDISIYTDTSRENGEQIWSVRFGNFLKYHCGIQKLEYGFDQDTPNVSFPLPEFCDWNDPDELPNNWSRNHAIGLTDPAQSMVVQITYTDNAVSNIFQIDLSYDD